jgi:murein DD-endopeptidase MepM/ murein hydrolase activator NlpD
MGVAMMLTRSGIPSRGRSAAGGRLTTTALALALAAIVSGCAPTSRGEGSMVVVPNEQKDSRGVITYATYQVVVARDGDTMETVATRLGISTEALASRNALPVDYRPREGEVLLLPDSFPRTATGDDVTTSTLPWSTESASAAIDSAAPTPPPPAASGDPLIDPVRHRVEAGETAYSIARLYGVSVTALASWNGLGPDLMVRTNQELLIPIVSGANQISGSVDTAPGAGTPVPPPPSATEPLPENITAGADPASPQLDQFRTPAGGRLSPPVPGSVSRPFNPQNPNGIGFAVPAGTPVESAGDGEVALISEELGGLGTIVLIRHADDLMTTYSVLSNVTVNKGDRVTAGQPIGSVAPRDNPELQFDVFRGTTAVDPTPYIR